MTERLADFSYAFLSLMMEGAPFILLGTLFSGLIETYLPPGLMERLLPRRKGLAVLVAGFLGLLLPVCECAVVPVIRRLIAKGLPVSCALTYMLAAPIINPVTILSTMQAFPDTASFEHRALFFTSSRLGLAYLIAVIIGLVTLKVPSEKLLRSHVLLRGGGHQHERSLTAALRASLRDFSDVAVYFTIGISITALFNVGIAPGSQWLKTLAGAPVISTGAMMALAFMLSLCSTSDAFIAATFDHFGTAPRLAFLVFGPMMDLKLLFLYQTIMKHRTIILLTLSLVLLTASLTLGWQYLWQSAFR